MDFKVQLAKDVGQTVAEAVARCEAPIMEPKYDGWRCIVIREADRVRIFNRSQKEYSGQLPELESDLMKLPVGTILDGELVALRFDPDTDRWENEFFKIHTAMRSVDINKVKDYRKDIKLIAFDCLAEGGDPRGAGHIATKELMLRRDAISQLIRTCKLQMVELTIQMPATQTEHDALVAMGFEGTVIKDIGKPYGFGKRGHGWFKVKDMRTIDCIVMDVLMDGKGKNEGLAGRMVVGQIKDGELVEVAKVNCMNDQQRREATDNPAQFLGRVLEVKIYGWDTEGPRHPTPMRWREDKLAAECLWSRV